MNNNINKILILALMFILSIASDIAISEKKQHGGKKQMAKLIWGETWEDGKWGERGFHADYDGYYLEYDDTLKRKVMYNEWLATGNGGGDPAMPKEVDNGIMKRVDPNIVNSGSTLYGLMKTQNFFTLYAPNRGHRGSHIGPKYNVQVYSAANAVGELTLDYDNINKSAYFGPNLSPTRALDPPVYSYDFPGVDLKEGDAYSRDQFKIQSDRRGSQYNWSSWGKNGNPTGYWSEDDVWIEVAIYARTNNGVGNDQSLHIYYRLYGTSQWKTAWKYDNAPITDVPSNDACVGWGTYLHGTAEGLVGDVKFYSGGLWFYSGNAVADGLLGTPPDGGGTTPPPDIGNPPIISDITATTTTNQSLISWKTDKNSTSTVDYGQTPDRGTFVGDDNMVTRHDVLLKNLQPGTKYFYRLSSKDADGNVTVVDDGMTFQTKAEQPPPEQGPFIRNLEALTRSTETLILWDTDKDSNSVVDYGTTESRGTLVRESDLVTQHEVELLNLTPETEYFYRVSSKDANGNVTLVEENQVFVTLSEDEVIPPEPDPIPKIAATSVGIAIDSKDNPHIVFYDPGKGSVLYGVKRGGNWEIETLSS